MPVLPDAGIRISVSQRLLVHCVVAAARLLATRPPKQIATILDRVSASAPAANYAETKLVHNIVLTVSTRCCGTEACLPRSLSIALLCRLRGSWPVWCAGVLAAPPFTAHAWVEAENQMVGEFIDSTTFTTLVSVPRKAPERQ